MQITKQGTRRMILVLLFASISGCARGEERFSLGQSTPPVKADASTMSDDSNMPTPATHASELMPVGFVKPRWQELKLPSKECNTLSLSPDMKWIIYSCGESSPSTTESWLAHIDNGEISNIKMLNGIGALGFTVDSTSLVTIKDGQWGMLRLSDLTISPGFAEQQILPESLRRDGYLWSPDGKWLASCANGDCGTIAMISPQQGTKVNVIENAGQHYARFSWSPDGQEIAYVRISDPTSRQMATMAAFVLNLESRQVQTLVEGNHTLTGASWSPTGEWIAVRAIKYEDLRPTSTIIWLVDPREKRQIELQYDYLDGSDLTDGWRDLIWSPDGSKLALRGWDPKANSGGIVIDIPTGKILLRIKRLDNGDPLLWSKDNTSLLVAAHSLTEDGEILRWLPVQP